MCAECHRSENGLEHHHVPVTPKYAYQFGRDGLDTMLINLKRAGVTRLNILKNPINASKLGTINRLVQIDLTRALEKVHGLRPFDLGEFRDPDDPSKKMLNSKKLTELLTENVHPKLFPKWMWVLKPELRKKLTNHYSVMSPNATLLAYTGPSNIKELRDQAALISILWREAEHDNKKQNPKSQNVDLTSSAVLQPGSLETLTIESEKSNIIVRAIQPRLLLILVGGRPPNREENFFKITAEALGDARYPPADYTPSPPPESASSSSCSN
jgi:hypothetical protein